MGTDFISRAEPDFVHGACRGSISRYSRRPKLEIAESDCLYAQSLDRIGAVIAISSDPVCVDRC